MVGLLQAHAERYAAIACVSLGLLVAVLLAPKNSFFLSNVGFYWASQLGVLALALLFKPRAAMVAGVALALAVYLAAFGAWLFTRTRPDAMAWLGYVFSLPGAVVGAIAAAALHGRRPGLRPLVAGIMAAALVLVGIALNQVVVCSTVMYCLGK